MLTIELLNSCAQFAAFDQADRCTLRAPALYALARMKAKAKDLTAFLQTYDPLRTRAVALEKALQAKLAAKGLTASSLPM